MTAWTIVFVTYGLAAVVSFFVAALIHLMGFCIQRFAPAPVEIPAAAANVSQQGGAVQFPAKDQEAEIAAAIAAVKAYVDRNG